MGVGIRLCPRCFVPRLCELVCLVRLWDVGWGSLGFDASFVIVLVWFVCIWTCSWAGSDGAL